MKKLIGIYGIKNIVSGKMYIGQSVALKTRKNEHFSSLNRGKHPNKHLQYSWDKYGSEAFIYGIIELCAVDELNEREFYWINYYDTFNTGYNQTTPNPKTGKRTFTAAEKEEHRIKGKKRWAKLSKEEKKKRLDLFMYNKSLMKPLTKSISIYDNKTYELIKTFDNYQECADYIGANIDRLYKKVIEIKNLEKRSYKGYVLIGESFSIEEYIKNKEELDRIRFIKLQEQKEFNRIKRELDKKPPLPKEELNKIFAENAKKATQAIRDKRDKVLQVCKDGIIVTTVLTPADVERVLGMKSAYVQKVLRGEKKSYKGHTFAYIPRTEEYSYIV